MKTEAGSKYFFQKKCFKGQMMAWKRSKVTANVTYTDPTRKVCKSPKTTGMMYKNTCCVYQWDSWGNPNDMIAMNRKRASNVASPLRSFENDAPPWRTTPDALVRTMIDMQLPTRPNVEMMVSRIPSVTKRKMSSVSSWKNPYHPREGVIIDHDIS